MKKLFIQAVAKFLAGLVLIAALLFLPAGTWHYPNGWLLLAVLFLPMLAAGVVLLIKNPVLLQKRLGAKEKESEQKAVIALSGLMFIAAFLAAGLSFRFQWLLFPHWVVILGTVLFLFSYGLYAEVLRENTYLSRTVEVQDNQQVIDTGLYGVVRHPMYAATLILFLSMGLVLGSPISVGILLFYIPILVCRIKNEETVLEKGLAGYADYQTRVRFRLIPFVW